MRKDGPLPQKWRRQERVAGIAGISLGILGALFGGWAASQDPAASATAVLVSAWLVGFIGYFLGVIVAGVLTAPKEDNCPF